jgi:hypothetical protein
MQGSGWMHTSSRCESGFCQPLLCVQGSLICLLEAGVQGLAEICRGLQVLCGFEIVLGLAGAAGKSGGDVAREPCCGHAQGPND